MPPPRLPSRGTSPNGSGVVSALRLRRYSSSAIVPFALCSPNRLRNQYGLRCGSAAKLEISGGLFQMASRPVGNGNISFGLVSIPVRLFPATRSKSVSFNLLHAKDLSRIQQKIFCPVENAIIDRSELVRGYEVAKGRY